MVGNRAMPSGRSNNTAAALARNEQKWTEIWSILRRFYPSLKKTKSINSSWKAKIYQ
jgi:hypothetical protein